MKNDKKDKSLYFIRISDNKSEPEYLKPEMLGTTKCLTEAGLFTQEEMGHIYSLRKKSICLHIEALPHIKNTLDILKDKITELKFKRDELEYLKHLMENGTIGSIVNYLRMNS